MTLEVRVDVLGLALLLRLIRHLNLLWTRCPVRACYLIDARHRCNLPANVVWLQLMIGTAPGDRSRGTCGGVIRLPRPRVSEPRPAPAPARIPRLDDGALDVRRRPLGVRVRQGRHDRGRHHLGAAAASRCDRIAVPRDARRPLPPRARDDGHRPDPGRADGARRRRDRNRRAGAHRLRRRDPDEPRRRRVPAGAGCAAPRPRPRSGRAVCRQRRREHARRRLDLRRARDRRHHPRALERPGRLRPQCALVPLLGGAARRPPSTCPRRLPTRRGRQPPRLLSPSCARACAPSPAIATWRR